MKYKIGSVCESIHSLDLPRDLPGPFYCRGDEIPDPESVPLSILDHPIGKPHEINFAAYDAPELTLSLMEGAHPVLVLCLSSLFAALTRNRLGVYYGFMYGGGALEDTMFKFTFSEGEDEHTFVAAGSHYRSGLYRDYEITGKWGPPLENGRIPVELVISYAATHVFDAQLNGVFDPEENSLRGAVVYPGGFPCLLEEFVFKRDPDFVRFYPAPSITNASERWKFATKSVLDRIQREAWSSKRISKRIKDLKRFMETFIWRYRERTYLDIQEQSEYFAALPGLYEADAELCASLIKVNMNKTTYFW